VNNIVYNDVDNLVITIKEIVDDGKDLDNFLWEVIKYVKDVLVYKATGKLDLYNEQEKKDIADLSEDIAKERVYELIQMLSELANTMKWSTQKTIMLQVGLMKCCTSVRNEAPEVITTVKKEVVVPVTVGTTGLEMAVKENVAVAVPEVAELPKKVETKPEAGTMKASFPTTEAGYAQYWPKVLDALKSNGKMILYTNLIGTRAKKKDDMSVEIEFAKKITPFAKSVLEQYENKEEISKMVSLEEGQKMQIVYVENTGSVAKPVKKVASKMPEDIGIDINIIDA